jgi:hypothetical protein
MGHSLSFKLRSDANVLNLLRLVQEGHVPWDEDEAPLALREGDRDGWLELDLPSHCQGWHREHFWAAMRWCAIVAGEARTFDSFVTYGPLHWLLYEGHEEVPIVVLPSAREAMRMTPELRALAVDEVGVPILPSVILDNVWMEVFDEMSPELRERVDDALAEARAKAAAHPLKQGHRRHKATREVKVRMGRRHVESGLDRIRDMINEMDSLRGRLSIKV